MGRTSFVLWLAACLAAGAAVAEGFAGTYTMQGAAGPVTLDLRPAGSGAVEGRLTGSGLDYAVAGAVEASRLTGTVAGNGERLAFTARLCPEGDHLGLTFVARGPDGQYQEAETLTLTRAGAPSGRGTPSGEGVVVNGRRLPDATLRALESAYGVRIQRGAYWYDRASGAWGFEDGPTAGFIAAGLSLGPLRADASAGNTGVFVNGRELHAQDVVGLRQLVGMVLPGRYWLDAWGNTGYEGGPALMNLVQISRRHGGGTTRNYGNGAWAYRNSTTGIGMISDGSGIPWISPD